MNKTLSVVIPCLNEESCIRPFFKAVRDTLPERAIEFVFVDDGSTDGTLAQIKALADDCPDVHFVSFSRNFGKEAALWYTLSRPLVGKSGGGTSRPH